MKKQTVLVRGAFCADGNRLKGLVKKIKKGSQSEQQSEFHNRAKLKMSQFASWLTKSKQGRLIWTFLSLVFENVMILQHTEAVSLVSTEHIAGFLCTEQQTSYLLSWQRWVVCCRQESPMLLNQVYKRPQIWYRGAKSCQERSILATEVIVTRRHWAMSPCLQSGLRILKQCFADDLFLHFLFTISTREFHVSTK